VAIESFTHEKISRRLRLGMIGGGRGAFIGAVHRMAARLDDKYELVAGALSSNSENAIASARDMGIADDRAYTSWQDMAIAEAAREDGIDVVSIVTPNHLHFGPAKAFLQAGIHVICDKPMTLSLAQAKELVAIARASKLVFVLTQNNTGYPLVRQARQMIADGLLGEIQVVRTSYVQDWLTTALDQEGQKQAAWRTDPASAGLGGAIGDIGVHAFNLAAFMTGLTLESVCADLRSYVAGRQLDDNANVLLRYSNGASGTLWVSQVAPGNYNRLSIEVYGTKGGLSWIGEDNDNLYYTPLGQPTQTITRGGPGTMPVANHATRMPARHPEGYIEGFANVYTNAAELIHANIDGRQPDPMSRMVPTVEDGAIGLAFIEACVASSQAGGVWKQASIEL
jgi:predicted dehydrogenase